MKMEIQQEQTEGTETENKISVSSVTSCSNPEIQAAGTGHPEMKTDLTGANRENRDRKQDLRFLCSLLFKFGKAMPQ